VRFGVLFLLVLYVGLAEAEWTGVAMEIADTSADWKFSDGKRSTHGNSISFLIEEETKGGLVIGGGIGYLVMRVDGDGSTDTNRFDSGEFLQFYLRQDFPISAGVSFHGLLSFRYSQGHENDTDNGRADLEWGQSTVQLGISNRFTNWRIMPFVAYDHVDGDINDDSGTSDFELDDPVSQGIRFDYFLEETAFIRLEAQTGDQEGGLISFFRRY
jgi:hypothetical protein